MIVARLLEGQTEEAYDRRSHCQVNPTNQMMRKISKERNVIVRKMQRRNPKMVRRRKRRRRRRRNLQRTQKQRRKDANDTRAAAPAMMKVMINTKTRKTRNITSVTMAVGHQIVIVTAQQTATPVTAVAVALIVKKNKILQTRKHRQVSGHLARVTCYNQPLKRQRL